MPRDFARIRKFCNQFASLWEVVPDMRFGQFTMVVFEFIKNNYSSDPFYLEDDQMLQKFREYISAQSFA